MQPFRSISGITSQLFLEIDLSVLVSQQVKVNTRSRNTFDTHVLDLITMSLDL